MLFQVPGISAELDQGIGSIARFAEHPDVGCSTQYHDQFSAYE
jgi:hypothetical protein